MKVYGYILLEKSEEKMLVWVTINNVTKHCRLKFKVSKTRLILFGYYSVSKKKYESFYLMRKKFDFLTFKVTKHKVNFYFMV